MKKQIETEIKISATPNTVWRILTDFAAYPDWNPFIQWVKGEVKEQNHINVRVVPTGSKGMTFNPIILSVIENKEIKWIGSVLFKGLFDGEHHLVIQENKDGTTTFSQREYFSGIFVGLFDTKNTETGFHTMNQKLKELAEAK
ncbi:hypothetical protein AGMMS49960_21200 [Betaproteobacteria bacterium]|nr:hypothetical protein AGMMS49960_21200 [Betaproteobacteria bacterium]GHU22446.1 hypothetical protein AGMMS50243_22040 [Betaproteobacteria bacterium]